MKRRVLSIILSLAVIITSVACLDSLSVFGADSSCGDNAQWSYNATTKTLTITGTGETSNYGTTGLNRAPWYSYKSQITTIVVQEGITKIGYLNFYNCTALTSVTLPSTLEAIGGGITNWGAFRECTALTSITLPEGLITIEPMAFRGCTALESVSFPNTLTTIDNSAFRGCTALKSIRLPNSLTTLGTAAFRECSALTTVYYGTGMTSTGVEAFYDCVNLNSVNFSSTITAIDSYSFYNTRLISIIIPQQITTIGMRAFANSTFLREATIYNANCYFDGINLNSESVGRDPFNSTNPDLVLYGHSGSTTQEYANNKGYNFVSIDDCEHESYEDVVVLAPTCTENGMTHRICNGCGEIIKEIEIPATNHSYQLQETVDSTATDGHIYTYYNCINDNCDDIKVVIEHVSYVDGYYEYVREGNCTVGYEKKTCLVEGCGKTERTPLVGNHQVENYTVITEPTCTQSGSKEGVCTVCGETITTTIPPTGHNYEQTGASEDTEEDGHTYVYSECTYCGKENITATHVEWVDGYYTSSVTREPGCVVSGIRRDVCNICNQNRLVKIPANGEHVWYETTRTEPTCTANGTIYYACENCDLTKTENIDALGHNYVLQEQSSVAPTCTKAGYNVFKCDTCGATSKDVLQATGHTIDETNYTILTEATCTQNGTVESVCTVCSEPFTVTVNAYGHNFEDVLTDIDDKPGHSMSTPSCTRCNQTEPATVIHNEWVEGYYTEEFTEGTCTRPSTYVKSCTLCDKKETQYGSVEGHKYHYARTESNGNLVYACTICSSEQSYSPSYVSGLFPQYINSNPQDKTLGYLFELYDDGIINAKDYALINKALVKAKAYNNIKF